MSNHSETDEAYKIYLSWCDYAEQHKLFPEAQEQAPLEADPWEFCRRLESRLTEELQRCREERDAYQRRVEKVEAGGFPNLNIEGALRIIHEQRDKLNAREELGAHNCWPNFIAPPEYENPADGWEDTKLPDFRLIWETARKCGYAVGLHGSMKRDCDLIAVPWTGSPSTAQNLIDALCASLEAKQVGKQEARPHGRISISLQVDGWFKPIDLSIFDYFQLAREYFKGA